MSGFFITGTDTGIGKTALTALLLAEFRRRGLNAAPIKPVQTGCIQDSADLIYAMAMAGLTISNEQRALMSPYCFEPACSPHLAAELAGTEIQIETILRAVQQLTTVYDPLLVEGAGGILVPLNRRDLMIDLMKALKLPVLLAARTGLGTLNHTLLSLRALREAQLTVAGVVLIASSNQPAGFIEQDNPLTMAQFSGIPVLGTIPYCEALQSSAPSYSSLPMPVMTEIGKIADQLLNRHWSLT